ncbi:peptidyl-prolyl cis-trans isomerase [Erythrobacter sp. NAP1]|uniref:peptidylprolyl isomerase n=1 Tax=Erythrobacter sp. NAP1 TaxID=237727 RepID=UPI0000686C99|nr:peptidylprolyl isomerase [Erythrobacter sp. NAP1]EAQ30068.1 peptidyl-prolyl cis-trans isomerase [Erythrobacter sp. NAP1]
MFKKTLGSLAALAVLSASSAAFAQEVDEALKDNRDEGAVAEEVDSRTFPPVEFDASVKPDNIWVLDLSNGERVKIRLMEEWAPKHVERIKTLTKEGFYDGVVFHRVIDGFMAQGGDPTGTGQGGSQLPDLEEEFNPMPHVRGTLSMARATDEDSANSQFFIVFYPRFSLDKRYTNLGRVIENMKAVDDINRGEPPQNPTRILQASLASDNKPPVSAAPAAQPEQDITADLLNAPLQ